MIVPVARPPPAHIVTSANSLSVRSSSCNAVVMSRAAVAPTGCPSAIAPPLTLTFARSCSKTRAQEIVRWATPVNSFQRTATQDTRLGGKQIKKGDRVGLFYAAANHDPDVFANPDAFDITRDPNPHLGFGGGGAHYCLGKSLAVLEIDLVFNAIADAMPTRKPRGDPRRPRSAWINGVKELQVSTD